MTQPKTREIARRTLDIIPLVMRVMSAEMRNARHAFSSGHMPLLGMLSTRSYTLSELAERHSVSLPTMSTTISTLEERGWVTRQRSTEDRRMVSIEITQTGRDILDEIQNHVQERIAGLLAELSQADQDSLAEGLTVLRDVFAAALAQDPTLRGE